jgi:hypothetical protein
MEINKVIINNNQIKFFNGVGYKVYPLHQNGIIRLQSGQHNPVVFINKEGRIEMHYNMKCDYSLRKGTYNNINDVIKDIIKKENLFRWVNFGN